MRSIFRMPSDDVPPSGRRGGITAGGGQMRSIF